MECNICFEAEKVRNPLVKCPFGTCQFEACRKCCQRYILDQRAAKCMNNSCGKEWQRQFVVETFPKTFVTGEWKKMREQVLFDREKALLPATQGVVEMRIRQENTKNEIRQVDVLIRDLYERRRNLELQYRMGATANTNTTHERRQFIRACPADDCRGFLSSQWKCGTCAKSTCSDCHEVISGEDAQGIPLVHICNPDNVATATLLSRDTKPCPKCATGIFKIEGCDQMWCTQCHTAFSWRSGFIETNIHNPHYYEWQRRMNNGVAPRVPGDVPCGNREITHLTPGVVTNAIKFKLDNVNSASTIEAQRFTLLSRRIYRICESVFHLMNVQVRAYQVGNRVEDNLDLRVEYLQKKISEDEFKIKVQRANKMHEKKREISVVLNMFVTTVADIMYRVQVFAQELPAGLNTASKLEAEVQIGVILDEVESIRAYSNECLRTIATTYGSKTKQLVLYDIFVHRLTGERNVLV